MSTRVIALLYFYLISAAAIGLMVIGIFSVTSFALNLTQYDKYPLTYYAEDCESNPYANSYAPEKPILDGVTHASPSASEQQRMMESCRNRVEEERKRRRLEDMRNAIVFPLVGITLFVIHFPYARKLSEEKKK